MAQIRQNEIERQRRLEEVLAAHGAPVVEASLHFRHEERYSGVIPHPQILAQFEHILPGSADRILTMAEKQQSHRHDLEGVVVRSNARRSDRGLIAGFIVALAFLAASVYLIINGHQVAGTVLGTVDLGVLVGMFVLGRESQRKERENKARIREEAALPPAARSSG